MAEQISTKFGPLLALKMGEVYHKLYQKIKCKTATYFIIVLQWDDRTDLNKMLFQNARDQTTPYLLLYIEITFFLPDVPGSGEKSGIIWA